MSTSFDTPPVVPAPKKNRKWLRLASSRWPIDHAGRAQDRSVSCGPGTRP